MSLLKRLFYRALPLGATQMSHNVGVGIFPGMFQGVWYDLYPKSIVLE
jgi:hypothetical protein